MTGPARALADTHCWLCRQLALQVRHLVVLVEGHCRGRSRTTPLVNDIVVTGGAINQLSNWLPAEQPVKSALQKLARILPALLQARDAAALTRLLQWLYGLHQQLQPPVESAVITLWLLHKPAVQDARAVTPHLSRWLRAHHRAGMRAAVLPEAATSAAIGISMLAELFQQVATLWRGNLLTPPLLSDMLCQGRALLHFTAIAGLRQEFDDIASRLCLAYVHPQLVNAEQALQCWERLWLLLQEQYRSGSVSAPCEDIELLQAVQGDFNRYRPHLQHYLQQATVSGPMLLPQEVMTLHYKLPWLLAAAGQQSLARLGHGWYQLLLVHWKHKLPLSAELLALLAQTAAALSLQQWSTLTGSQVLRWFLQLLRLWPSVPAINVQQIALPPSASPPVELAAIPILLSRSFTTLSNCQAEWLVDEAALQPHRAALQEELLLLEKGAAAVRIHEVEIFCSLLLSLHQRIALRLQHFPGDLLWRSHQHLLALLDEAAAWQPPQLDLALIAGIKRWLQASHGDYSSLMVREPTSLPLPSTAALLQCLREFVDALGLLIDLPLRFDVSAATALPVDALPTCEQALKPLLLALVLEQAHVAEQRRATLRPQVTEIAVVLASTEEGIAIEVIDEGHDSISTQYTQKRLRAKLPAHVQLLTSEALPGLGRRFRLLVKTAPAS